MKTTLLLFAFCLALNAQNPPVNATQLRGRNISTTAPTNGQVYEWDTATLTWKPATVSGGASPAGGVGAVNAELNSTTFQGDTTQFQLDFTGLATPAAPTLATAGTAGVTTYGYELVRKNLIGGSIESAEATIATGNATLTSLNKINITPPACTTTQVYWDVYRSTAGGTPSTTGLIIQNSPCGTALADTGLAVIQPYTYTPGVSTSIGVGSNIPYINTSTGSQFGSWAQAGNRDTFWFNEASAGLGVIEHTGNPDYGNSNFLSYLVVDTERGGFGNIAGAFSVDQRHALSVGGPAGIDIGVFEYFQNGFDCVCQIISGVNAALYLDGGVLSDGSVYIAANVGTIQVGAGETFGSTFPLTSYWSADDIRAATPLVQGLHIAAPTLMGMGAITTFQGVWVDALGGLATNPYSFWSDEAGVFRIRADNTFNAVYQAIPALYNPQFTKYTPGAANYERIAEQWESNVGVITTEKGGTGTLRNIQIDGAEVDLGTSTHLVNIPATTFKFGSMTCSVGATITCV